MAETKNSHSSSVLTNKEIRRYALQIKSPMLGVKGQEELKKSKVLVVGAGGKGTSVLENLVTIGIGKIGICDNFPVEEHELSRQHLYGNSDLGKQKAIISREKLREINHLVEFQLHNVFLAKRNIEKICEPYDLIIDATDNYDAHCLIDDACIKLDKPVVFGSVNDSCGSISVFNYKKGPTFRSLYPNETKLKADVSLGVSSCQITIISMIGAMMANEAIKVLMGSKSSLSGTLLTIDPSDYSITKTSV